MCLFLSSIKWYHILKSHEQYLQMQKFAFVEDLFSIIRIFKVIIEKNGTLLFCEYVLYKQMKRFFTWKRYYFHYNTFIHKSGGQSFYGPIFFFSIIFLSLDHSYFLIRRFNVFHFWKIFFWNVSKIRRKHVFPIERNNSINISFKWNLSRQINWH